MRVVEPYNYTINSVTASLIVPADYIAINKYRKGQLCKYDNAIWVSTDNFNLAKIPSESPKYWLIVEVLTEYTTATFSVGALVKVTGDKAIYKSLQDTNSGHTPSTSPTWWKRIGSTNLYKFNDEFINTQTCATETIRTTITVSNIDTIAIMNLDATDIQITYKKSTGEVIKEINESLAVSSVLNLYDYFHSTPEYKKDFLAYVPAGYIDATLEIVITKPASTVKAGIILCGSSKEIGATLWGVRNGISNYGRTETDVDFGMTYYKKGAWAKEMDLDVKINTDSVDIVHSRLIETLNEPTLFIGDERTDGIKSTLVFGYFENLITVLNNPSTSECALEIKGVI